MIKKNEIMKTQLIILNSEQSLIVSDEEMRVKDLCYNIIKFRIEYYSCLAKEIQYKIIAGIEDYPAIAYNGFEEQFGIVDVEKLAQNKYPVRGSMVNYKQLEENVPYNVGFIEGFKTAQQLNNKKFSVEEVIKLYDEYFSLVFNAIEADNPPIDVKMPSFLDYLQESLSKIKVFDIEIETAEYCEHDFTGMPCFGVKKPKIINNQIKIIKIL